MPNAEPSDIPVPVRLTADGYGRLPLPRDIADKIPWLKGVEPVDAWLFLLSSGRFRLLNEEQVQSDPELVSIRTVIFAERPGELVEPSSAQPPELASLPAKLLRITLRPHSASWRMTLPPIMEIFAPANCNLNDFAVLFSSDGYWELWYTQSLREAALGPLPAAMRRRSAR